MMLRQQPFGVVAVSQHKRQRKKSLSKFVDMKTPIRI